MSTSSGEAQFLDNLPAIDRQIQAVGRRRGLHGADLDDFTAWIRLKLIENDYEKLTKYHGDGPFLNFLSVVIANLANDHVVARAGRWRPSAIAKRAGRIAERLEQLVYRRGHSLNEAAEILRSSGETQLSDAELAALYRQLPRRRPLRPVQVEESAMAGVSHDTGADHSLDATLAGAEHDATLQALEAAIGEFEIEDRLILKMRFWDDLGVAEIARGLGLEQKPLYRRLEGLFARLRKRLAIAGITEERVREVLEDIS